LTACSPRPLDSFTWVDGSKNLCSGVNRAVGLSGATPTQHYMHTYRIHPTVLLARQSLRWCRLQQDLFGCGRSFRLSARAHGGGEGEEPTRPSVPSSSPLSSPETKTKKKLRLDEACLSLRPEHSRNVIQSWILQGKVLVDGRVVDKPGSPVKADSKIAINAEELKFVCRGGFKLEKALDHWALNVTNRVCLDSGLSTGGFTDCLLQRGAKRVYGIDVGYGQVAEKIRQDERVIVMERTNLRYLTREDLPERVDLVSLDLSFISIVKCMPAVRDLLKEGGELVALIKPQFEAGKDQIGAGGVVRDKRVHQEVLENVRRGIEEFGFVCQGTIESPIRGAAKGNKEFLAYFHFVGTTRDDDDDDSNPQTNPHASGET